MGTALRESQGRDIRHQWVNVVAFVVMLTVNALANILPINGLGTGEISDKFPVFFVPAGYVFSIWGVIYLALAAFVVHQATPKQRANPALRRIGYLFALSCLANTVWIFLWHYELFPLTLAVMLSLLGLLTAIYLRLDINRAKVFTMEKWLLHIPFSIYLGWITVATIANVTDVLYYVGWSGWGVGPETWAVVMLAATTAIACAVGITRGDAAYIAVIVWAFIGIVVKQADTPIVAGAAGVGAGVVVLVLLGRFLFMRPNKSSLESSSV